MNKSKLTRLARINTKLGINLVNMKDLIRWCEDYKAGRIETVGSIIGAFTLTWNEVAFVIENLDEIKELKKL